MAGEGVGSKTIIRSLLEEELEDGSKRSSKCVAFFPHL
jgi:hypothetical protein